MYTKKGCKELKEIKCLIKIFYHKQKKYSIYDTKSKDQRRNTMGIKHRVCLQIKYYKNKINIMAMNERLRRIYNKG